MVDGLVLRYATETDVDGLPPAKARSCRARSGWPTPGADGPARRGRGAVRAAARPAQRRRPAGRGDTTRAPATCWATFRRRSRTWRWSTPRVLLSLAAGAGEAGQRARRAPAGAGAIRTVRALPAAALRVQVEVAHESAGGSASPTRFETETARASRGMRISAIWRGGSGAQRRCRRPSPMATLRLPGADASARARAPRRAASASHSASVQPISRSKVAAS